MTYGAGAYGSGTYGAPVVSSGGGFNTQPLRPSRRPKRRRQVFTVVARTQVLISDIARVPARRSEIRTTRQVTRCKVTETQRTELRIPNLGRRNVTVREQRNHRIVRTVSNRSTATDNQNLRLAELFLAAGLPIPAAYLLGAI